MPKKTTAAIIESGNDYVIGVKKNQPKLYRHIEEVMSKNEHISSRYAKMESNRGRTELRQISVSELKQGLHPGWKGVQQLVCVERIVHRKKGRSQEKAYFISSRKENAFLYEEGIRLHWQIENSLHYVKDVTFQEDASKIRTGQAAQNISTVKNAAINILRNYAPANMARAIRLVAHDIKLLKQLIL